MNADSRAVGEVIKTRIATLWVGTDGIGRIVRNSGVEEDLSDAKELIEAMRKLLKGEQIPCIIDIRRAKSITREARELYTAEEAAKLVNGNAILVDSPLSRMLGSFYMAVNKPIYPAQVFSSEQKAIKWLKKFL